VARRRSGKSGVLPDNLSIKDEEARKGLFTYLPFFGGFGICATSYGLGVLFVVLRTVFKINSFLRGTFYLLKG
jgi:hypothetical protein